MNFEEFKKNVEAWATERGIYEHSTPEAQLLKTLSEIGELADAVIKDDLEGLKDAVGDVAVCWINYCKMKGFRLIISSVSEKWICGHNPKIVTYQAIAKLCGAVQRGIERGDDVGINLFLDYLIDISIVNKLDFFECCELAWNEIKDRKGHMVAGGAFVKEGEE